MKNIKYTLFMMLTLSFSMAFASHWVRGYTHSNGTYVAGHMSDDPGEEAHGHWHHNVYYPNHEYKENNINSKLMTTEIKQKNINHELGRAIIIKNLKKISEALKKGANVNAAY